MQTIATKNHKAERQLANRELKKGNRYQRQQSERREGPNVRVYELIGGQRGKGYIQIRTRDGKQVSKTPA